MSISAGSATYKYDSHKGTNVNAFRIDWTSNSSGAFTMSNITLSGRFVRFVTVPDGGGTQPSANYDITFTDRDGIDIMATLGANRSNTATENVEVPSSSSYAGIPSCGNHTLSITNAGDTKGGIITLYVEGQITYGG